MLKIFRQESAFKLFILHQVFEDSDHPRLAITPIGNALSHCEVNHIHVNTRIVWSASIIKT